jgi:hypothetical protein
MADNVALLQIDDSSEPDILIAGKAHGLRG